MEDDFNRRAAEKEYLAWAARAGGMFSPFYLLREPVVIGPYRFWTIEALWLGSQLFSVKDLKRVSDLTPPLRVGKEEEWSLCCFPAVGQLQIGLSELKKRPEMRMLRRVSGYDGKRNRFLGRGNWRLDTRYYAYAKERIIDRAEFLKHVHLPYYLELLRQFPEDLDRLKALQRRGEAQISPQMCRAHTHLRILKEILDGQRQLDP
jgi:hypothetical protein